MSSIYSTMESDQWHFTSIESDIQFTIYNTSPRDGTNGGISGLLGLQLLEQLGKKINNGGDKKNKN